MSDKTATFEVWVLNEILQAKAKWLGLVCAVVVPKEIARLDVKGNLRKSVEFLKSKNAIIKEFSGANAHSEVWLKGAKIGEFYPRIVDKKLDIQAFIAGVRVDVTPDPEPEKN